MLTRTAHTFSKIPVRNLSNLSISNLSRRDKLFIGIVTTSFAGFVQHQQAKFNEPTLYSISTAGAPVMSAAFLGIMDELFSNKTSSPQNTSTIKDDQRKRIEENSPPPHIANVNNVCDAHGIPLTEKLANLFIMQYSVHPAEGSPMDAAFEFLIIENFYEELIIGLQGKNQNEIDSFKQQLTVNLKEKIGDKANEGEIERRINSFNAVGVAAHTAFNLAKIFTNRLSNAGPDATNRERLPSSNSSNSSNSSEKYHQDCENYKQLINEAIYAISDVDNTRNKEKLLNAKIDELKAKIQPEDNSFKQKFKNIIDNPYENNDSSTKYKS